MALFLLALLFCGLASLAICETIATVRANRLDRAAFAMEWNDDAAAHVELVSTVDLAMALTSLQIADVAAFKDARAAECAALSSRLDRAIAIGNRRARRAARIEAIRAFVPNVLAAASARLTAARVAIRWTVAGSATLRALRRVLRAPATQNIAAATVAIALVLGSIAVTVRSGLATRSEARASVKALRPSFAARSDKPRAFRGMTCKGRKNARGFTCVRAEVR